MEQVRMGIIGCGKAADFHAKAMQRIPSCRLIAASNHTKPKPDAFCSRYHLKGCLSPVEMIRKEKLNAVTICTPHPTHAAIAVACAAEHCHVLVEKPLASSTAECDAVIKARLVLDSCNLFLTHLRSDFDYSCLTGSEVKAVHLMDGQLPKAAGEIKDQT